MCFIYYIHNWSVHIFIGSEQELEGIGWNGAVLVLDWAVIVIRVCVCVTMAVDRTVIWRHFSFERFVSDDAMAFEFPPNRRLFYQEHWALVCLLLLAGYYITVISRSQHTLCSAFGPERNTVFNISILFCDIQCTVWLCYLKLIGFAHTEVLIATPLYVHIRPNSKCCG